MTHDPQKFRLAPTDDGLYTVEVGGVDVSHLIGGVQVHVRAGERPLVLLEASPKAADIELLSEVVAVVGADESAAVETFLSSVDPAALEEAALARLDLDAGKHGLTTTMLRQLAEWSRGS